MHRLNSVSPEFTQGRTKELLDTAERAFGTLPSATKVMTNSSCRFGLHGRLRMEKPTSVRQWP